MKRQIHHVQMKFGTVIFSKPIDWCCQANPEEAANMFHTSHSVLATSSRKHETVDLVVLPLVHCF